MILYGTTYDPCRVGGSEDMPPQKYSFRNRTKIINCNEFWSEILLSTKKVCGGGGLPLPPGCHCGEGPLQVTSVELWRGSSASYFSGIGVRVSALWPFYDSFYPFCPSLCLIFTKLPKFILIFWCCENALNSIGAPSILEPMGPSHPSSTPVNDKFVLCGLKK